MRRLLLDDSIHFLTVVTANRRKFFVRKEFCQVLMKKFSQTAHKFSSCLYAFAICSNHYHLVFHISDGRNRGKMIQAINGGFSFQLRQDYQFIGNIWGNKWLRFVDSEKSFWRVLGYVMGNPLKHRIVKNFDQLAEFPFSSFGSFAKKHGRSFAENLVRDVIDVR
jgi:putative transposase